MRKVLFVLASAAAFSSPGSPQSLRDLARISVPGGSRSAAFSPDRKLLAVVCGDAKLRVLRIPSGDVLRTAETGAVTAMAFSPGGRWIATGSHEGVVRILEWERGAPAREWKIDKEIESLVFSPDEGILAIIADTRPVELWDVASGKRRARLATDFGSSAAVGFSPDGTLVGTADEDTRVRVHRVETGTLQAATEPFLLEPFALDFSPDGKKLLVGGIDKAVVLVDARSGRVERRFPPQADPVAGVAFLRDERSAVATYFHADHMSAPAPIVLWSLETGEHRTLTPAISVVAAGLTRDRRLLLASVDGDILVIRALD